LHGAGAVELAEELGCRALGPTELLEANDVEAILIASRTNEHVEHALAVLASGKHMLLEKPGAIGVAEQGVIRDAAAAHPELVVRVAYHRRHDPRFQQLASRVAAGDVGEPYALHMRSNEDFAPSDADRFGGGFLLDVGVHEFDTARWLLGTEPTAAYAVGTTVRYAEPDNYWITLNFGPKVAAIALGRTSRNGLDIRCEVFGDQGSLLLSQAPLHDGLVLIGPDDKSVFPADCRDAFAAAYVNELTDFASSCRGQEAAGATLEDDAKAVATGVAVRASASLGTTLEIGSDWEWERP
jgi:predicted dehydrogenase